MIAAAQPADLPNVLALWADQARGRCADTPWPEEDLQRFSFHPWNQLQVVRRDGQLVGAVLLRLFIEANGDRAERLEPFLALDPEAERELFEWVIARQRPEGTVTSADAWMICGCEGVASEFGFEHSRTFLRLDR